MALSFLVAGCPRPAEEPNGAPPDEPEEEPGFELQRIGDVSHVGEYAYEQAGVSPHCEPAAEASEPSTAGAVEVLWNKPLYGQLFADMPTAVVDDRFLALDRYSAWLYQLDVATGGLIETFRVRGFGGIGLDGLMYLWEPGVVAVDPISGRGVRWRDIDGLGDQIMRLVALPDGRLLVRDDSGYVSLRTPEGIGYEIVWEEEYGSWVQETMAVDLEGGRVILAVRYADADVRSGMLAIDIEDGSVIWDYAGPSIDTPLILGADRLITYSTNRQTWARELRILSLEGGQVLHSVVAEPPRSVQHSYGIGSRLAVSPSDDRIYLVQHRFDIEHDPSCCVAELTAYDDALNFLWRRRLPWPPSRNPEFPEVSHGMVRVHPVVAADGTVYVSSQNCHVYALDRDGNVLWWDRLPFPGGAQPVLVDDGVLIAVGHHEGEDLFTREHPRASVARAYRTVPDWEGELPCPADAGPPCPTVMEE